MSSTDDLPKDLIDYLTFETKILETARRIIEGAEDNELEQYLTADDQRVRIAAKQRYEELHPSKGIK